MNPVLKAHASRKGGGKPVAALAAGFAMLAASVLAVPHGFADTAPTNPNDPKTPVTVSADALPTVQIDGVVWSQTIIGNTVYAVGKFSTARPAGAAPGSQTVPRQNILAYSLTTGALISSFAPTLNAQGLTITTSPDKTRLYVGGDFTSVSGQIRNRVVALNPTTGAVLSGFAPKVNGSVRAVVASEDTVWVGGLFTTVGTVARNRLAAFRSPDGFMLAWNPNASGGRVNALTASPDYKRVVAGGAFTTLNGSSNPGYGLAATDAVSGSIIATPVNDVVRNAGDGAAITSLSTDGTNWYGTAYDFAGTGLLEGSFSANWSNLGLKWLEDCHGDSYSIFASNTAAYVAGHPHYCGNLGGFPETNPRTWHRAVAFSKAATRTLTADTQGYKSFTGQPAPELLTWFPDMDTGTATGQNQGPWHVTGNSQYILMGGEFKTVNFKGQQGLVRYAVSSLAPNKEGPRSSLDATNPVLSSPAKGQIKVRWQSNWDRDNSNLTYQVYRDGVVVNTQAKATTFWNRPTLEYVDTVASGSAHSYRIGVKDPFGNAKSSTTVSLTAK
ncbi:hypothetical protein [Arthrobacter sp. S39]|uniref:hypothetical protein n=1 Tax=Arthrobacter sp. S39 TaxID=2509720 RepID=UPI0010376D70|nr:hypothetical protein [Arthrobacter sp. S39]TAP44404.1 hypothetical protein EYS21_07775 [Arthrobacter sp. S39]